MANRQVRIAPKQIARSIIRDEFNLHFGARMFAVKLRKLGIDCFHEEFDDGHFDIAYRYERSLLRLWEALKP